MSLDLDHVRQVMEEADCLYTQQQVEAAMDDMAVAITQTLKDSNPIVYSVMNGGLIIAGQLLTRLHFPMEVGYLHATRYRNKLSGSELFWKARAEHSLVGRTVLIIDDILDEGHTLDAIMEYCRDAGAAQVLTAVLLDKTHDRKAYPDMRADFTGLDVVDRYVFGYGLDYKGYWRNAPGIYALKGH